MYYPLNYDQISTLEGLVSPSDYKVVNTVAFNYWVRALYRRVCSRIEFKKVPPAWEGKPLSLMYWALMVAGYVLISRDDARGYWFQPARLSGFDFYYQPVRALIANPLMEADLEIGTECELLRITSDYFGLGDVIGRTAAKLAEIDNAIDMAIKNSKLAYVGYGRNAAAVRTLKTIRDRVNRGQDTVFVDSLVKSDKASGGEDPIVFTPVQDVAGNYILDKLIADEASLLTAFDTDVGIPTVPYAKKERMTQFEGESRISDASAQLITMQMIVDDSMAAIKDLYPDIPLEIKINVEEVDDDGMGETDADRPGDVRAEP